MRIRFRHAAALSALAFVTLAPAPAHAQRPDPVAATTDAMRGFEPWIVENMKAWVVPGMAVGIVRNGKVVYARGFGMRDIEKHLPVDPGTLFAIGSATKAFTAFDVGLLVDDGKVDFETPVSRYLPGLELADPVATREVTLIDMMSHRTGLPRHDAAWYNNDDLTPAELFKRLRYFEPNKEFRQTWQYNNMMFATAGYLVSQVSGQRWEDFTRTRILEPLGMTHTNFTVSVSEASPNHATPYGEEDEKPKAVPFRKVDNIGPAGSINSNVDDMVKWVAMQLSDGKLGDKQLIQTATLERMHTPQMVMAGPSDPMIGPSSYGLAWMLDTYRGHYRVRHGGNIDGFSALVALFPFDSVGMVVLSNKNSSAMPELAARQIADRLFGLDPRDWSRERLEQRDEAAERAAKEAEMKKRERVEGTTPSHPLRDFVGAYEHPGYGTLTVRMRADGELEMEYNRITAPLEHWHYDVFNGGKNPDDARFENTKIEFLTGFDGSINALRVGIEPAVDPEVFNRVLADKPSGAAPGVR